MRPRIENCILAQVNKFRTELDSTTGLPFRQLLDPSRIHALMREQGRRFRQRLFCPMTTVWVFLSQVISGDKSCQAAVNRFVVYRACQSKKFCSSLTGSYCKARNRLSESFLFQLLRETGHKVHEAAASRWDWKGRSVKVADGTTILMADTPANQKSYPQNRSQKPGLGCPIVRMVGVFSLSSGALLDLSFGRYEGKGCGETSLLSKVFSQLNPNDVLVGDRYFSGYGMICSLIQQSVDCVFRLHGHRNHFSKLRKIGNNDWLVQWNKPKTRPVWMGEKQWLQLPRQLILRQVGTRIEKRGFRTHKLTIVTTLINSEQFSSEDFNELYQKRWQVELDLRAIKQAMNMEFITSKTPQMVRKEIAIHLLAYNLIRTLIFQAALNTRVHPKELSFKVALRFLDTIMMTCFMNRLSMLMPMMLAEIAKHRVGKRPGRREPRCKKKRHKRYSYLMVPRNQHPDHIPVARTRN